MYIHALVLCFYRLNRSHCFGQIKGKASTYSEERKKERKKERTNERTKERKKERRKEKKEKERASIDRY